MRSQVIGDLQDRFSLDDYYFVCVQVPE